MPNSPRAAGPAARYRHDHPPVADTTAKLEEERLGLGQRLADCFTAVVGSWTFVATQSVLLVIYMGVNIYLAIMGQVQPGFLKAWDPYPFIFLNLILSFQSAYAGPVILMSQNRQTEQDRLALRYDFEVNRRAEEEIKVLMDQLVHQEELTARALERLEALADRLAKLRGPA